MQIDQIKELIQLLDQSSVHEMELETSDFKLSLKKETQQTGSVPVMQTQAIASPAPQVDENIEQLVPEKASYRTITSPMVGTFYSRPAPDKEAFVNVGERIESGQVVCILEAMKLFNDVEAEISGEIVEVLVTDGDLVEFGQPLFSVK
ncbi:MULTISPECIES: acetyl-CoA carboxylase biotin carboxyl carrier protein [unclassified Exiguobacterium]|uniref:acetyl-CoA carboxylase biotin carboxyl carrier protein n=1 Tax=unclassified Exiguobacterium TaxID=2644629 RepID=UPI001BEC7D37|nr:MULTISPECIES: acetyl-CoA carboxylase biotin carboxyl carrier protein [unclassified Exiguobacterium]